MEQIRAKKGGTAHGVMEAGGDAARPGSVAWCANTRVQPEPRWVLARAWPNAGECTGAQARFFIVVHGGLQGVALSMRQLWVDRPFSIDFSWSTMERVAFPRISCGLWAVFRYNFGVGARSNG